ncbi:DUF1275 domain-containing protein [Flavobacterium salilacus subsp. salilacus]|uniref:YoaK family protein n=1 Tax=Flavobacterium TaxID=237 RepID=UPI0010752451|nr:MULTISPECIES: YoaK family protein [Flavobacterium]KAF2518357.1 DUF1275 domain-containing protein [Flavobacterium salilacus subsp. salilacus]MBE1615228.1 DUF1275 domain-containing protein [Flavobacterium sp. SaA2.13]NDI99655.1 DUF1275 domain-containing protein [Flavobacterium salilacus subsp. altitudinum]
MLRNRGNKRAYRHNFRLAAILSFVAGIVNICGLLALNTLTTNLTGHFAFFSEAFINNNYKIAVISIFYVVCFLAGSFISNLTVELVSRKKPSLAYAVPIIIEILIIAGVALFINPKALQHPEYVAAILLFAMGLQNSLVTKVSQSVVRTTHLTGLFTDLGIELSQLFFYKEKRELQQLKRGIYLKLSIILFFFAGGIAGGLLYKETALKTLLVACCFLILALLYDSLLLRYYSLKHKITHKP